MKKASVTLNIKAAEGDLRQIEGWASKPDEDRVGDIVMPRGAKFKLPLPFLLDHDHKQAVGEVDRVEVTDKGIRFWAHIKNIAEPGEVKDLCDKAWALVKNGLRKSVSIGFSPKEYELLPSGGLRFTVWEWLELSAVTVPALAGADITNIKSYSVGETITTVSQDIDAEALAASGRTSRSAIPPGVSGTKPVKVTINPESKAIRKGGLFDSARKEGSKTMRTVSQQIADFQEARKQKSLKMQTLIEAANGETLDGAEAEEFDTLSAEVKSINSHLARLEDMEALTSGKTVKAVAGIENAETASAVRGGVQVKAQPKLAPGIAFAQIVKAKAMGFKQRIADEVAAERMYGSDSQAAHVLKAAVASGLNGSGWASDLTGTSSQVYADFAEYLRPQTILGKFGQGNIPSLRTVPFRTRLVLGTGGGSGYWVGEGKPKPLTAFDFDQSTLDPLKVANICVLSMENVRDSSPSSDLIVRDELVKALAFRLDTDFINPAKTASAGVSPASITNGVSATHASGTDADAVREDVGVLLAAYIAANNPPESGVIIMSSKMAMTIGLMRNSLGQREFPDINMAGGMLEGFPVIASQYVPTVTAGTYMFMVNAQDIYLGDEGGYTVDVSTEASLEMLDGSLTQDAGAGTGASLVSLWQTNSIGILAERTINWKKRRSSAVATIDQVAYALA